MPRMNYKPKLPARLSRSMVLTGLLLSLAASVEVDAQIKRSAAEVRAFRAENACPATGLERGPCPGYEVDHFIALCLGGDDTVENMQWLSVLMHRAKTRVDVSQCRLNRLRD